MDIKDYRQSKYNIDPVFINRWSPRAFKEQDVPEEDLFGILEAASWAPSAANIQPWRFMIARTEEERERFYSVLLEGNLAWCKKAPVLALLMSKKTTERGPSISHGFDAGAAWAFLSIEATKRGLITHAMGGFQREEARVLLGIPEDYDLHVIIAIGYQGDKSNLSGALQDWEKPSSRLPLEEVVFEKDFQRPIEKKYL